MSLPLSRLLVLTAGPERLRLCLVGPTGAGKTARVEAAARELGLPVVRLLLQSMLPEDVLGLPRVLRGRTAWSVPDWAARLQAEPGVLFLDEIDKPRPEVLAAVLTLVWDLRLRDIRLHEQTVVVCAMQPVDVSMWRADETTRALSARLIYLPVGYADGYAHVARETGAQWVMDLAHRLDRAEPELPVLEELSPRQVMEAIRLARAGFPPDVLARGIAAGELAEWLAARLNEEVHGRAEELAPPVELARTVPLEQLFDLALDWAVHGPSEAWSEALVRIWVEGDEDLAQRFLAAQWDRLKRSLTLCGEEPESQVVAAFRRACERIAEAWAQRGRAK